MPEVPRITIRAGKTRDGHVGSHVRRGFEAIQEIGRVFSTVAAVAELKKDYQEGFIGDAEAAAASDYYRFRLPAYPSADPDEEISEEAAGIEPEIMSFFYFNSQRAVDEFGDATSSLWNTGADMVENNEQTADGYVATSQKILKDGYEQTRTLSIVNSAKATPPNYLLNAPQIPKVVKLQIKFLFDGIGTEKPESFREATRRHMPRWMWHPIPFPEGEIAGDREGELRQLWSGYTSRDAGLLIHPDRLAEGQAPFHMIMKAAQKVEKDGAQDLGYAIRTYAITQLLDMESERAQQTDAKEMPFFTYVFGGAMTGEVNDTPKNAHFSYQTAISDTMRHTFSRLQTELQTGSTGPATKFLESISAHYLDAFPKLLARSIKNHERAYNGFDIITIIRGLEGINQPWVTGVKKSIADLPVRRVLTSDEIIHLASFLPESAGAGISSPEQLSEDIEKITGDSDIFSFKEKIREANGLNIDFAVDVDTLSETFEVRLLYTDGARIRFIPFELSFAGGDMKIDTVDQTPLPPFITDRYRGIVLDVIKRKADEIRAKEAVRAKGFHMSSVNTSDPIIPEQRREKVKTRPKQPADGETNRTETVLFTADRQEQSSGDQKRRVTIAGLDIETISALLGEERIEAVTPERILEKLHHHLRVTNETGRTPGKPLLLEDTSGNAQNDYDLRQINWSIDNGNNKIRVYIYSETGNNRDYELVGITKKTSRNDQNAYLRKLVRKIAAGKKGTNRNGNNH